MTPIAKMVQAMIAAGVAPDMIALAVQTAESVAAEARCPPDNRVDAAAEKRRAWDREYRRTHRPTKKQSTRNPPEIHPIPPETENRSLSLSLEQEPLKEERKKERARGIACPPDFATDESDNAYGVQLGLTRAEIEACAEEMRLWGGANSNRPVGRKADWHLTLKGWLRRAAEKKGNVNGKRTVHDAARDLSERLRALDEPAPSELRERTGGNPVRLLSSR